MQDLLEEGSPHSLKPEATRARGSGNPGGLYKVRRQRDEKKEEGKQAREGGGGWYHWTPTGCLLQELSARWPGLGLSSSLLLGLFPKG